MNSAALLNGARMLSSMASNTPPSNPTDDPRARQAQHPQPIPIPFDRGLMMLLSVALFMIMFFLKEKITNVAYGARNHRFLIRVNNADDGSVGTCGNHARSLRLFTHSSLQTFAPVWHRRAWTRTSVGSGRCKSTTSFPRVRHAARRFRPRSCRRWGLCSRMLIRSWACSFRGC